MGSLKKKFIIYNIKIMYKVVSECNNNEVWATGFCSKEKAQNRINKGYFHRFMYEKDKNKKLIIIKY